MITLRTPVQIIVAYLVSVLLIFFASGGEPASASDTIGIRLQGKDQIVEFEVSRPYLLDRVPGSDGLYRRFSIAFVYPSLMSLSAAGEKNDQGLIIFHVGDTKRGVDYQKAVSSLLATEWLSTTSDYHSLRRYIDRINEKLRVTGSQFYDDFYLIEGDDRPFIKCLHDTSNPNTGCSSYERISNNLELIIQFPSRQLASIGEIRSAVYNLIGNMQSNKKH